MATRRPYGVFTFESAQISNKTFKSLEYTPDKDLSNYQCLTAMYNPDTQKLDLFTTDCSEEYSIVCRKILVTKPDCTGVSKFQKKTTFEMMLSPSLKRDNKLAIAYKKAELKDMMKRLNQTAAFKSIFSSLWYAYLPCFDIRNMTSTKNGGRSVLRYCEWKGMPISCSAIFTTFPTDRGMCCSFNKRAAQDIYIENTYTNVLAELQQFDKNKSFISSSLPKKFIQNNEPKTVPGRNKGLVLMLDAHSDLLTPGSIDSDFRGFMGVIGSGGSFPLTRQEGFEIRPGYNNIVTLTGSKVVADDAMIGLKKTERNCLFPEENSDLKIHKNYTYLNCMFECSMYYAQKEVFKKHNSTCQPWFFPSASESITMCDPWESFDFFQIMTNEIPDKTCNHCLSDCTTTIYEPSINAVPFDTCDFGNLGMSLFCSLNYKKPTPMTAKIAAQIKNEFQGLLSTPDYIFSLDSTTRTHAETLEYGDIFTLIDKKYDAFEKDIAMVQIFYKKSTVLEMGSKPKMTWIDYFSTVGGLLGLVLGMGIISFVELIWLCLRILAKQNNMTDWIS